MQLFPVHTIADAVGMEDSLDPQAVEGLLTQHSPGLSVLVAPVQPDAKDRIKGELIGRVLRILKERFDVVVVDTPPAFDDVVLQAFDESDLLLLVANLDVPALKSLKITAETLGLLNHPTRPLAAGAQPRRHEGRPHARPRSRRPSTCKITASIPQSNDVPTSINHGKPIVLDSPKHPVSQAIKRLALDCLADAPPVAGPRQPSRTETADAKRGGLLRRRSCPMSLADRLAQAQAHREPAAPAEPARQRRRPAQPRPLRRGPVRRAQAHRPPAAGQPPSARSCTTPRRPSPSSSSRCAPPCKR